MHAADSHDRIRVHGARVNNLRDVSIELPKRRLTAFTGISGSGKSSLVFGTIAAESQRLINETYSAFVQGFMPSQARPDVDLLDGLTTAIIVDQERMGANTRSTVGTLTELNDYLKLLFARAASGFDPKTGEEIRPDRQRGQQHHRGMGMRMKDRLDFPPQHTLQRVNGIRPEVTVSGDTDHDRHKGLLAGVIRHRITISVGWDCCNGECWQSGPENRTPGRPMASRAGLT